MTKWLMNAEITSSDYQTVAWAKYVPGSPGSPSGVFQLNGAYGAVYEIGASSATLTVGDGEYILYLDTAVSRTSLRNLSAKLYISSKNRLKIATMKAQTSASGLHATYELETNISLAGGANTRIKATPDSILSPVGRILSGDGTQGAPTFSFTSDPNSGMYQYGDDQVSISVAGTARFITTASGIYATTTTTTGTDVIVTAGGLFAKKSSSIQYKDNVETLDFDSSKLDSLRPVSYNYKSDNAPDIGLIAEEVNEVYPELINYNKEGKPESVKYNGLSVMLLEEVTKLRQEVNELKEKN